MGCVQCCSHRKLWATLKRQDIKINYTFSIFKSKGKMNKWSSKFFSLLALTFLLLTNLLVNYRHFMFSLGKQTIYI